MGRIVQNRWLDALLKTIIVLLVVHVVLLLLGWFFGTNIGLFGMATFWPHLTGGWVNLISSIIIMIALYFIVYYFFTDADQLRSA